jgi:hypothetical protein
MKTKGLLIACIILLATVAGYTQNPIPSFNVPVYHYANFQEKGLGTGQAKQTRGKRVMVIRKICAGTLLLGCNATVWVYSLDGRDILGPYSMGPSDDILRVEIDDREWGVLVESDDHVTVDVWIELGLKNFHPCSLNYILENNLVLLYSIKLNL